MPAEGVQQSEMQKNHVHGNESVLFCLPEENKRGKKELGRSVRWRREEEKRKKHKKNSVWQGRPCRQTNTHYHAVSADCLHEGIKRGMGKVGGGGEESQSETQRDRQTD